MEPGSVGVVLESCSMGAGLVPASSGVSLDLRYYTGAWGHREWFKP